MADTRGHNEVMKEDMEYHEDRRAHERRVRFRLESKQYSGENLIDQWYEPEADSILYKVHPR